uniref:Uncharacterized protein n=1 Tax=Cacopsylla melanoneura TaxID=428564 RepID=A0A8D8R5S6_9HEMI
MTVKWTFNGYLLILVALLITQSVHSVKSSVIHASKSTTPLSSASDGSPHSNDGEGRVFYSGLGDLLMRVPFFPVTINVPDALSSVQGFFSYFFTPDDDKPEEPRDDMVLKLVKSALEITDIEDIGDELFF